MSTRSLVYLPFLLLVGDGVIGFSSCTTDGFPLHCVVGYGNTDTDEEQKENNLT